LKLFTSCEQVIWKRAVPAESDSHATSRGTPGERRGVTTKGGRVEATRGISQGNRASDHASGKR